jgi:uncharacterized protein (DUF2267 family)
MELHEFLGQVQRRARLATIDEALKATRATLQTLASGSTGASPATSPPKLPTELRKLLEGPEMRSSQKFGPDELYQRLSAGGGGHRQAVSTLRAVADLVHNAVSPGAFEKFEDQLPDDHKPLFGFGSESKMRQP